MQSKYDLTNDDAARVGSWVYTYTLPFYDLGVIWLSNNFIWRCPSRLIRAFYTTHISDNHLDVGVGSGYFLDTCQFPSATPNIVLVDLNEDCLIATSQRIRRYRPKTVKANLFNPLGLATPFDSIGINYVFHCLPGNMADKTVVFQNLADVLKPGGKVFGTTILGQGVSHNSS